MHPKRCGPPHEAKALTDLPNIGPAMAEDLRLIGITHPGQLVACDPYRLYDELCVSSGVRHDPCVIDVLISVVRYMDGQGARVWWDYTAERKASVAGGGSLAEQVASRRSRR
ncbi:helix-hairpin-helix domain-containing protein [Crenobacter cavernae]|uniref:Mitomycin resistance protein n=1 Tax=Crenobacter cavernae TaxID=2290923 RepID=A0A345YAE8_9NEIS|nr:helix-hairpin-helix domain-containing protein [Crenobacter cavernae]AXK40900.1 mitomycin resistance protein [Crenobacter cavernae]